MGKDSALEEPSLINNTGHIVMRIDLAMKKVAENILAIFYTQV